MFWIFFKLIIMNHRIYSRTFIIPHFDYCSTIYSYFPKATLQKIYSTHNYIISKLLNLNATVDANNFSKFIVIKIITDCDATFVYFCSKFINNFILEDLKNNFYTFRKLLYNNWNSHFCKIMSNISKVLSLVNNLKLFFILSFTNLI